MTTDAKHNFHCAVTFAQVLNSSTDLHMSINSTSDDLLESMSCQQKSDMKAAVSLPAVPHSCLREISNHKSPCPCVLSCLPACLPRGYK